MSDTYNGEVVRSKLRSISQKIFRKKWLYLAAAAACCTVTFGVGIGVGSGQFESLFSRNTTGLPNQLDYSSVNTVYNALKQNYNGKLTANQLLDGLKAGMAQATNDPYTEYFTAAQAKAFNDQLNNSFSGIGAELGQNSDGDLIVVAPIKGFPADKAGLKSGDIIAEINGKSTTGIETDVAANDIRGPQGTTVQLTIVRNSQEMNFSITREDIHLPSVTSKILDNNIGYIQITSFADDTSDLMQKAAQQMVQANVKGVILDLRGNPGGELDAAVNVSSLWLSPGQVAVSEKGTIGSQTYTATGNNTLHGIPTVVLIDGGSASASEITAGALHDNNVAHLIGVQSFGKGVVQQLINFRDGSQLKVTVASWYRPNGQNIQKKGITPDQIVPTSASDTSDVQLTAAEAYLNK